MSTLAGQAVDRVFRNEGRAILATLIEQLRDIDLAEEVLQDAYVTALEKWSTAPLPDRPAAWLLTTARRKALDRIRRRRTGERKLQVLMTEREEHLAAPKALEPVPDDELRLMFTCCHPALSAQAQVALTLSILGGLNTKEIARAFLVPEVTMAQRLVRAKRKIKHAGIPYRVPDASELGERLAGVLAVVYLIFNEGYFPRDGERATRTDLCDEAIRLCRHIVSLLPKAETLGLLSLMVLQHARRDARVDADGVMVRLEDHDRARWRADETQVGLEILNSAIKLRAPGPYQIQAAISALHAEASLAADTDWPQIVLLYRELAAKYPTPVVELNLSVALANLRGPEFALRRIEELSDMDDYQPYFAARADLLRRLQRYGEAVESYDRALALTDNSVVVQFLRRRRRECGVPTEQ